MRLQCCEETAQSFCEAIIDDTLVLERLDLVAAVFALLVDLRLLCANEGFLVDVGVDFDVAVVRQLKRVLGSNTLEDVPFDVLKIYTHLL